MPLGIGRAFNRLRGNRNQADNQANQAGNRNQNRQGINPPAAQAEVVRMGHQAAANGALNLRANAAQAAPVNYQQHDAQARANRNNVGNLSLCDLRIRNEANHDLVTIPEGRRVREMDTVAPIPHPETDHLSGREFLTALSRDPAMGICFKGWVGGRHILGNESVQGERLRQTATKLRLIASACRADHELKERLDIVAMDASNFCSDRSDYFMNTMWGEAFVFHVSKLLEGGNGNNDINPVELYNLGVGHFRLETMRSEVARRIGVHDYQSVHTMLEAEIDLQDRLDLPTQHRNTEDYPNTGRWTPALSRQVEHEVKQACSKDEGRQVIHFMSNWQPWVQYMTSRPDVVRERDAMVQTFQDNVNTSMEKREDPNSDEYKMTEEDYINKMNRFASGVIEWKKEVTGQATWAFLANYRSNIIMDGGRMPQRLTENN